MALSGPVKLTVTDENKNVAKQAPELNSPAYALIQALQHHHRESSHIDSILSNPDSLNCAYNPLGTTALMRASEIGSKHLQRLLEAGAFVDAVDKLGRCALHYAAKTGADESINLLIAYGADPNIRDSKSGETPIFVACREGKDSTVRFLAQSCGVSWYGPKSLRLSDQYSPLHETCRWGHAGSARVLLGLAEVESTSKQLGLVKGNGKSIRRTSQEFKVGDVNDDISKEVAHSIAPLLIDVVNNSTCGVSAISIASLHGHLQVLWVLIQSGAIRQHCDHWFPNLDPKLHTHLSSWVDVVLDDPRLAVTTNKESTSNQILHELRERLEPQVPVNEDDIIDDGAADY